ncbi:hypothetical protein [Mesorhizobium sp.]|uniref:hypothetical protein n=1 Tax=Mesorhizobium sp. TaxID=1871066 RepID=UPI000FE8F120|nr:hypothetical protein [Mesorhizobium sp.]RWH32210.1 MAG: hypothetical protein EOQ76_03710 [Mesorhizobium sp.]RWH40836.1 MAG: hypothetical protein EOQ79_02655 [Mesorhizobium sp.]TIR61459.1 MAG: hypothetical protein E5X22_04675 [Mesorhizobium sp.]TIR70647.1 MAG: hypothetical protein E5X24_08405 [Mesorhizobium sp.]
MSVDLTKKGEAYAAAAARETLTLIIDRSSRKELATSIEALIDMLDDLSPDPDLEDGADAEPWLGWTDRGPQASSNMFMEGRGSAYDDREAEDEHGGDINDEPQADDSDDEHSLGWTEEGSQTGNLGGYGSEGDLEPDLGFVGHGTGWRKGEDALDWGEHDDEREHDEREPNGDETDGPFDGDGSGRAIAEKMLREKAKRRPSDIMRKAATASGLKAPKAEPVLPLPVPLLDPDAMDLRAH